jgi:hypothetical protein
METHVAGGRRDMMLAGQCRDFNSMIVVFDKETEFIRMKKRRETAVGSGVLADCVKVRIVSVQACFDNGGFFGEVSEKTIICGFDPAPQIVTGLVACGDHEPAHRIGVMAVTKPEPRGQINVLQNVLCAVIVSCDRENQLANHGNGIGIKCGKVGNKHRDTSLKLVITDSLGDGEMFDQKPIVWIWEQNPHYFVFF